MAQTSEIQPKKGTKAEKSEEQKADRSAIFFFSDPYINLRA